MKKGFSMSVYRPDCSRIPFSVSSLNDVMAPASPGRLEVMNTRNWLFYGMIGYFRLAVELHRIMILLGFTKNLLNLIKFQ